MPAGGARRSLRYGACALFALVGMYQVGKVAVTQQALAAQQPRAAYAFDRDSAEAGSGVAEALLARGDIAGTEGVALHALAEAPMQQRTLRILGLVQDKIGHRPAAEGLMLLAGGQGWRDVPVQLWLMQAAVSHGDLRMALDRADALARRPASTEIVYPLLDALASQPEGMALLTERLADVPWRAAYLGDVAAMRDERIGPRGAVMRRLKTGRSPPTESELSPLAWQLVTHGDYARAAAIWRAAAPGVTADAIYDGGFDRPTVAIDDRSPFQWTLTQGAGAEAGTDVPSFGPPGRALYVRYDGTVAARAAQQLVVAVPGRYRLVMDVGRSQDAPGAGDFRWSVQCAGSYAELASARAIAPANGRWNPWSMTLTVPSGCAAQTLILETRNADRQEASGMWFDNVRLVRLP